MTTFAERSMGLGLRALTTLASSETIDKAGLRKPLERVIKSSSKNGFKVAAAASRQFNGKSKNGSGPARQDKPKRRGLFDLAPTEEQEMLQEAFTQFAESEIRPIAQAADAACATPPEVLEQSIELGTAIIGVPEALDGAIAERSAVTSVLLTEKLAHGDPGIAVAILARGGVSTALGLWGDADQQSKYLPAFTGETPPPAAVAVLEPQPLFDPFALKTTAKRSPEGFTITGVKSLVPRAAEDELFIVAADLQGEGPALFIVESSTAGISVEPEPAMGIRAAATGRVTFTDVKVPADALLGGGSAEVYAEAINRSRLAWCAIAVGAGQAVLDHVKGYVVERSAFGEPIAYRQAVAFMVANIAIELEGMRLATLRAAARADAGKSFSKKTAIARTLCSEKGMQIGSDGVQLLGGHGYIKEYPEERWYRDLRAAGLVEGALLA